MKKVFIAATITLAAGSALAQQVGESTCVAAVRASLRDPGSMQLVRVTRDAKPALMTFGGREVRVRTFEVVVNAKNGFGGYAGSALWGCVVDAATERSVLYVLPPM